MNVDKVQQWLLRLGWVISAVLMIRFAIDFAARMSWWLVIPFCVLVIASLGLSLASILSFKREEGSSVALRSTGAKGNIAWRLLLAAIPISLFASSLDCTGLSPYGCSPFCTFVKLVWIPVIAGLCVAYFVLVKRVWLVLINLAAFVALIPHCVCYNVGNGWWIDVLGASPLCYGWGFLVSVLVVGSTRSRANLGLSLLLSLIIISGSIGFFVSHHYFHYPW
ncbi:MAG TPA: hypothetical protein VKN18_00150 [Blastocatellia bacterium]|nr:hypothetical protein [Blastocatellia bacterium]